MEDLVFLHGIEINAVEYQFSLEVLESLIVYNKTRFPSLWDVIHDLRTI